MFRAPKEESVMTRIVHLRSKAKTPSAAVLRLIDRTYIPRILNGGEEEPASPWSWHSTCSLSAPSQLSIHDTHEM
jgi:hypothetical protein